MCVDANDSKQQLEDSWENNYVKAGERAWGEQNFHGDDILYSLEQF